MAGVVALATALALAGCASRTTYENGELTIPEDPFTMSDALGATGGLLMIPFFGVIITAIVMHFIWYDQVADAGETKPPSHIISLYLVSGAILVVAVVLWVAAIWGAVGK